jgi:hypothetical protein
MGMLRSSIAEVSCSGRLGAAGNLKIAGFRRDH